jgi:hypothetical protein
LRPSLGHEIGLAQGHKKARSSKESGARVGLFYSSGGKCLLAIPAKAQRAISRMQAKVNINDILDDLYYIKTMKQ